MEEACSWVCYEEGEVRVLSEHVGEVIGVYEEGLLVWKLRGGIRIGSIKLIVRMGFFRSWVDVCTHESTFSANRLMRCQVFALSGHIFGEGGGCEGVGLWLG